jgi:hypothetical protein
VRILQIPYRYLYPAIIIFISVGVYSLQNSVFDVLLVAIFGLLGVALRLLRFHAAPLLLGMVLGPLLEENLRRSMVLSRGDPTIFVHSPISAVFPRLVRLADRLGRRVCAASAVRVTCLVDGARTEALSPAPEDRCRSSIATTSFSTSHANSCAPEASPFQHH